MGYRQHHGLRPRAKKGTGTFSLDAELLSDLREYSKFMDTYASNIVEMAVAKFLNEDPEWRKIKGTGDR